MKKKNYYKLKPIPFYCSCLIVALTTSQSALSEDAAAIDEVLVTAQMREESAQSVAISMGVYSDEFIANAGATSLTEMESSIPNLNFGRGGRNTRGEIAIRGIGDFSRNIGMGARVAVYVDGVLTGRSSSFDQSLLDVDHVEVLRGPQGTLAGTNALAGSINIITQKPDETFNTEIFAEAGDYNLQTITGKINAPLTSDLFASLIIGTSKQDGFIHNLATDKDLQNTDRETAKLKFRYVGVDSLTVDVGFDYLKDDTNSTNGEAMAGGGFKLAPEPWEVAHDAKEFGKRELKGANITANYVTPENYQWVSITGIRENTFSELSEEDYSPLDIAASFFDEDSKQLSQEFRFVSPQDEKFDYVIGTYFLDQDISTERSALTGARFPLPNRFAKTPASVEETSYSAYMHGDYSFTNNWKLSGGLRYVHETKNIDFSMIDTLGSFINVNHLREEKTFNELLPKIGLSYEGISDTLIYSSISRGYKSGGWNADFINTLENFQFNPEYAINYELGIKSAFLDNRITVDASSFVTKIRDFQVFQFVTTNANTTILSLTNAGKVTSKGLELDINAKISQSLTASVNAAFTQAKFDEFKNGAVGVDYDDNYLPFAPEEAYYVALDYRTSLSGNLGLYGHVDYSYSGDYYSNPDNAKSNLIEDHFTSNARIGLTIGDNWDIALWVKNLTDEANLRQRSTSFLGVPRGYYNPPRFYGLSVKYSMN